MNSYPCIKCGEQTYSADHPCCMCTSTAQLCSPPPAAAKPTLFDLVTAQITQPYRQETSALYIEDVVNGWSNHELLERISESLEKMKGTP